MSRPALPMLFFLVALVLAWPRLQPLAEARFSDASFATTKPTSGKGGDSELLPRFGASAHAVTLAQGSDGNLVAAWFSGSREGAEDVAIVFSALVDGTWTAPRVIADRHRVERDSHRVVRKLGNPLLWRDPQNVLHLWFVSVSYGGWAGSSINHMESIDNGVRWSASKRIITSPFGNLSTLVRNPPIALRDGGVALPAYHEFINKRPEWLHFDANMMLVDKSRIPGSAGTLQPAAVAISGNEGLMLLRDAGPMHRLHVAHSADAGSSWLPAAANKIDNPNSAIAMIRLGDGSLLLAGNPQPANRNQLALLRSTDSGKNWSPPHVVEQGGDNDEFSYPALLQDDAGRVHLAYTWKRQTIKHMVLSSAVIGDLH